MAEEQVDVAPVVDDNEMVEVLDTITNKVLGPRPRSWLRTFPHLRMVAELEGATDELAANTVPQLEAIAEQLGVDLTGLRKKADIVAAIAAHRASTGDAANENEEV